MKPHICVNVAYTDDGCTEFRCGTCRRCMEGRFGEPTFCMWCGVKFDRHVEFEKAVQNRWKRAFLDHKLKDSLELSWGRSYMDDPLASREEGYLVGCRVEKKVIDEEVWEGLKHTGIKRLTIYEAWKDNSHTYWMAHVRIEEMLPPDPDYLWDDEEEPANGNEIQKT